ncbi:MAG: cobalt-precorrin-5B (C(1))-methyltransferase, partial [Burkholderia sp.]|nr:cobalt-precorrin-5B (C(1))-methyltransferase [Burkholderia sp.]
MRDETPEQPAPLRFGYTTGSCATATSLAAARLLLAGQADDAVEIVLPKGQRVMMRLEFCRTTADGAEAGTIKDAGDDPDVTHGALIFARVALAAAPGVRFHAGPGVGTVTRAGLTLPVGEPAINPVPRQMMTTHLETLAAEQGYAGGFDVTIGVEGGEALALKTMNPRLGIVGGLSILGTTGIVRPFSCSAYIASIHQGIDVARANGIAHIAACTGNASEDAMRAHYHLPDMALIEMGDFAGAVLKHLRRAPVARLSMCGGFGKLSKLAA